MFADKKSVRLPRVCLEGEDCRIQCRRGVSTSGKRILPEKGKEDQDHWTTGRKWNIGMGAALFGGEFWLKGTKHRHHVWETDIA